MKSVLYRWGTAAIWVYFTILFGWLAAYLISGDRFGSLSVVNLLAVYLFFPLVGVFVAALFLRRWEIWAGVILGAIAFLWFWGKLFIPSPSPAAAGGETLTVMTYNVLGWHTQTAPQLDTIRVENADVVLLQEVNPGLASALKTELGKEYPYQILDPAEGVTGMGVISKYPIQLTEDELPLDWIGVPQVLEMDWKGTGVSLVNFHMQSSTPGTVRRISLDNRRRQAQAQVLAGLANSAEPLIVAGDANATPLSDAYRVISSKLTDSWVDSGSGLGHTFPGSDIPGSSRPRLGPFAVPRWLMRIDYIFHSSHWSTVDAHTAPFDGVSDHRGVVAELKLKASD
ncbi:MAG: endonuclease/exonuclease/phosphatase family protein [Anaerolineales bacterium]|jgi:endonuclease/exonuclease/phosphatase (EEP) superfamily protein YafD